MLEDDQGDAELTPVDLTERWPADRPLPQAFVRPVVPCPEPKCRAVRLADGRRAAFQPGGGTESQAFVRFQCRACGHGWRLPVRYG
jgi:hypothetical protein